MAGARLTYQQALYLGDMVKSTRASGTRALARVAHFTRPNGELVCWLGQDLRSARHI